MSQSTINLSLANITEPTESFHIGKLVVNSIQLTFRKAMHSTENRNVILALPEPLYPPNFGTIQQISEKENISETTLYDWCYKKKIVSIKIGNRRLIDISTLEKFLEERENKKKRNLFE